MKYCVVHPPDRTSRVLLSHQSSNVLMMRLMTCLIILLVQPLCCLSRTNTTGSNSSIYRESESKYQPPDCRRCIRPAYLLENSVDAHRLVVTIPEEVSRKNLKVDVDYDEGRIEFFGWWFEGKIRGEAARKMCVYDRWDLNPDLLSEEAIISPDLVSVYDIYMSMQNKQLVLSVPMMIDSKSSGDSLSPPPSPREDNGDSNIQEEQIKNHASIVIAYGTTLWKKLRGLLRLKDHTRNFSNYIQTNSTTASSWWDLDSGAPPSIMAYQKFRQDALDDFLKHALSTIDGYSN